MANCNSVYLRGNLTREPELRYLPSGVPVSSFGLAVPRRFKRGDEWQEEVCFVDIVVFGRQAEVCSETLQKGSSIFVEGRLQWRSWEAEDGTRRSKHEVVANNVHFLARPRTGAPGPTGEVEEGGEDDIPF